MSLLETALEAIKLAFRTADIDIFSNGEYEIISGRNEMKDEGYPDNLTYIGTITRPDTPVIIQISNALSTDRSNIKTEDKKEAVLGVTVYGHYTEDDPDSPPYRMCYPKKKNVVAPVTNIKDGTHTESKNITLLTSTEGATIKHTTSGFEPTSRDITYSAAIIVDKNTTLKTKVFKSGVPDSLILTGAYMIKTN